MRLDAFPRKPSATPGASAQVNSAMNRLFSASNAWLKKRSALQAIRTFARMHVHHVQHAWR